MATDEDFLEFEDKVFDFLAGKLSGVTEEADKLRVIEEVVKMLDPTAPKDMVGKVLKDASTFEPIEKYLHNDQVEDIMVNTNKNIFVYQGGVGEMKVPEKLGTRKDLERFVKKLRMYATSESASKNVFDGHLPSGSRANIIESPVGANVTIRNYRGDSAYSMIDLVNAGELSWNMAGRFWLYSEGLKVRPANMLIGGTPGAGKTTILNAMFSFFRPEERIVVLEETYELNTNTQENCVRLETSPEVTMEDLLKNTLRMRPDMIIVGEVRGAEAKDMMTAMTIGKIGMSTIHASNTRDIVNRLEQSPMKIERGIIPVIDALIVVSEVNENSKFSRKVVQVSEISGIESVVLLSDLYSYDYKTHKGNPILPSVTYRDNLAKLSGYSPNKIIEEEGRRAKILERLSKIGIRDLKGINEFCKEYYDNPTRALAKIDLAKLGTIDD